MQILDFIDFAAVTSALGKNPLTQHLFLAITDPQGNPLSSTPWRRICSAFHRVNPHTRLRCRRSDSLLANQIGTGESYAMYTCFNSLTDAAAPIIVNGEHIGNLVAGQVFVNPPEMDFFARQAELSGFDRADYLKAVLEVPVVSEPELRKVMEFYAEITSLLGSAACQAYQYKELADRLERRTAELEYVNSELEAFSYSVSHDLRAPLRHIMGFIELFNKKFANTLPDQGRHYFDVIHGSARQMSRLIDELLQFSRNGRAEMIQADVDMNAVVAGAMKNFTESEVRPIEWHVGGLPPARCDGDMFGVVWHNMIDNAVKFTGKTPNAIIEIGSLQQSGQPVYFIRDNGAGFDMKYAGKLFGVFQRMHPADEYEGTGIGLATVKRIISRHGGRIWAEAEPGNGASFYFTLGERQA